MANQAIASVGTVLSVSNSIPATINAAGFTALSYTVVSEAAEVPEFGAEQALVTFTPLQTGVVEKRGGSVDYGEVTIPLADSLDAGSAILEAKTNLAVTADKRVSVRVVTPNGVSRYFLASVRSFRANIGGSDAIVMASTILAITSPVFKV